MGKRGRVYNRIFTNEEWDVINKENKYTMTDYLEEYKQRKIKPSTIEQYHNDLRIIMIYINRFCDNKNIFNLTKKDFRRLSIWLSEDLKLSNARVNRLMSSTRSLLTYCESDDEFEYEMNVAKKIKGLPKEPVKVNEDSFFITFDQVMKLREVLLQKGELQLAVLHMLMFDSGARRNEVFQANKHNLIENNKTNIVVGKRGKTFPLVYLNDTRDLIKQYLEARGEDDIDSLWIVGKGENKRPVTYESLYDRILIVSKMLSELENKEINIFPHTYRHSRAECLLEGHDTRIIDKETGNPKKFTLQEVQMFLHHSDPKTTQNYAKDHTEEIINNMFNF